MMIVEIKGAITGITGAIQIAKGLQSVKEDFDAATYKLQMADLMGALADAKIALVSAQESAIEKDKEIDRLKQVLARKEDMVKKDGYFYEKMADSDEPKGYPFCSVCLETDGHQILTADNHGDRGVMCPINPAIQ